LEQGASCSESQYKETGLVSAEPSTEKGIGLVFEDLKIANLAFFADYFTQSKRFGV
jgi:hypothetical protein